MKGKVSMNGHMKRVNGIREGTTDNKENGKLKRRYKKRKSSKNDQSDIYEVECIISHSENNGQIDSYLVKWAGWDSCYNTWEPSENVKGCYEVLAKYFQKLIFPDLKTYPPTKSRAMALKTFLSSHTQEELNNLARIYLTPTGHKLPDINVEELDDNIEILAQIPPQARDDSFVNTIKKQLLMLKLKDERTKQLEMLQQWESDINITSKDPAPIRVINCIDLEGPPPNFTYINKYIAGYGIVIPNDPPVGCDCNQCGKNCCCIKEVNAAYTKDGLIKVQKGTPIYECNKRCTCPPSCKNRVVQRGRTIPVVIFKTSNGCGWGVKTQKNIKKGEFVVEYVGEVITSEEADRRGKIYDKIGLTYLFDLDFNDKKNFPYTVDAALFGNISHFINHSCNPNLAVYAIWVDCLDPNLPRLGLFAIRDIAENEELTFDYLCLPNGKENLGTGFTHCKCGEHNCRKFLF